MRVGILETGRARAALGLRHGSYPAMIRTLLSAEDPGLAFSTYAVVDGDGPTSPGACDAWVITGSKHSAHERLPWMLRLEAFLRDLMAQRRPVAGICFGHQILAQAMGGTVERASAGWGLGVHCYDVAPTFRPTRRAPAAISLSVVHQDQVTVVPERARVVAGSAFCPAAVLSYGDHAITFQGHPEFSTDVVRDLVGELVQDGLPEPVAARAHASLDAARGRTDAGLAARWILDVFRGCPPAACPTASAGRPAIS